MANDKAGKDMVYCKSCGKEIAKSAKACPSCGAENKQPFYKSTIFILLILFVFLPMCGLCTVSSYLTATGATPEDISKSNTVNDNKDAGTPEATPPKAGDALEGISPAEISEKHREADAQSSYQAEQYRNTLAGTRVVWVAKVVNVDTEFFGEDPYLSLDAGKVSIFAKSPAPEDLELPKGTLVKVTGTIDKVTSMLGLNVYFEGATIEVIE